jgi:spore coat protein U-like protein
LPATQNNRAAIARWLVAAAWAVAAQHCWAVQCTISAPGVNFGGYDPFSNQHLDGTGTINVICDVSSPYSIAINPGGGTYVARVMVSAGHALYYNLYTDASRTIVWGDGTGSTVIVNGSGLTGNHTVYGRVPARQNAYVGTYGDIITMTLTF